MVPVNIGYFKVMNDLSVEWIEGRDVHKFKKNRQIFNRAYSALTTFVT